MTFLEKVKFDNNGLVTCIVQDFKSNKVLMCAFMNEETLKMTMETKKMTYWSRSRKKVWLKGEESGNFQIVKEVRFDCDGDAIVFKVDQTGGACHEGWESCFAYLVDENNNITEDENKLFDPKDVYNKQEGVIKMEKSLVMIKPNTFKIIGLAISITQHNKKRKRRRKEKWSK